MSPGVSDGAVRVFVAVMTLAAVASGAGPGPAGPGGMGSQDDVTRTLAFAAVVFTIILVFGLVARAIFERRSDRRTARDALSGVPLAVRVVEGTTLRYHIPMHSEVRALAGRLEVARGDESVREVRFFPAQGQAYPEVTVGRVAGFPLCHVQVRATEVAALHARLSNLEGRWHLANLARPPKQPTRYRGALMAPDEQVALADGDEIGIGPVAFVFRA